MYKAVVIFLLLTAFASCVTFANTFDYDQLESFALDESDAWTMAASRRQSAPARSPATPARKPAPAREPVDIFPAFPTRQEVRRYLSEKCNGKQLFGLTFANCQFAAVGQSEQLNTKVIVSSTVRADVKIVAKHLDSKKIEIYAEVFVPATVAIRDIIPAAANTPVASWSISNTRITLANYDVSDTVPKGLYSTFKINLAKVDSTVFGPLLKYTGTQETIVSIRSNVLDTKAAGARITLTAAGTKNFKISNLVDCPSAKFKLSFGGGRNSEFAITSGACKLQVANAKYEADLSFLRAANGDFSVYGKVTQVVRVDAIPNFLHFSLKNLQIAATISKGKLTTLKGKATASFNNFDVTIRADFVAKKIVFDTRDVSLDSVAKLFGFSMSTSDVKFQKPTFIISYGDNFQAKVISTIQYTVLSKSYNVRTAVTIQKDGVIVMGRIAGSPLSLPGLNFANPSLHLSIKKQAVTLSIAASVSGGLIKTGPVNALVTISNIKGKTEFLVSGNFPRSFTLNQLSGANVPLLDIFSLSKLNLRYSTYPVKSADGSNKPGYYVAGVLSLNADSAPTLKPFFTALNLPKIGLQFELGTESIANPNVQFVIPININPMKLGKLTILSPFSVFFNFKKREFGGKARFQIDTSSTPYFFDASLAVSQNAFSLAFSSDSEWRNFLGFNGFDLISVSGSATMTTASPPVPISMSFSGEMRLPQNEGFWKVAAVADMRTMDFGFEGSAHVISSNIVFHILNGLGVRTTAPTVPLFEFRSVSMKAAPKEITVGKVTIKQGFRYAGSLWVNGNPIMSMDAEATKEIGLKAKGSIASGTIGPLTIKQLTGQVIISHSNQFFSFAGDLSLNIAFISIKRKVLVEMNKTGGRLKISTKTYDLDLYVSLGLEKGKGFAARMSGNLKTDAINNVAQSGNAVKDKMLAVSKRLENELNKLENQKNSASKKIEEIERSCKDFMKKFGNGAKKVTSVFKNGFKSGKAAFKNGFKSGKAVFKNGFKSGKAAFKNGFKSGKAAFKNGTKKVTSFFKNGFKSGKAAFKNGTKKIRSLFGTTTLAASRQKRNKIMVNYSKIYQHIYDNVRSIEARIRADEEWKLMNAVEIANARFVYKLSAFKAELYAQHDARTNLALKKPLCNENKHKHSICLSLHSNGDCVKWVPLSTLLYRIHNKAMKYENKLIFALRRKQAKLSDTMKARIAARIKQARQVGSTKLKNTLSNYHAVAESNSDDAVALFNVGDSVCKFASSGMKKALKGAHAALDKAARGIATVTAKVGEYYAKALNALNFKVNKISFDSDVQSAKGSGAIAVEVDVSIAGKHMTWSVSVNSKDVVASLKQKLASKFEAAFKDFSRHFKK